jgi:predicted GIY-YIG superfamily endonuclease
VKNNGGEVRLRLHYGERPERNDLHRRDQRFARKAYQHRNGLIDGFTRKHGCKLLVWYEGHGDIEAARARELQMKKWKRSGSCA